MSFLNLLCEAFLLDKLFGLFKRRDRQPVYPAYHHNSCYGAFDDFDIDTLQDRIDGLEDQLDNYDILSDDYDDIQDEIDSLTDDLDALETYDELSSL